MMIEDYLRTVLTDALRRCADAGLLPAGVPDRVALEQPPQPDMGDFSTNVALIAAKSAGRKPRDLAHEIVERIAADDELVARIEVAGPGFINFHLKPKWLQDTLAQILRAPKQFGRSEAGAGKRVNVEFVSANPVGPLHIGNARGGPIGDVLASLFEWTGHQVTREYYVNDGRDNTQLNLFGKSVRLRYLQALGRAVEYPPDCYQGEYVQEYAALIRQRHGDALAGDEHTDLEFADLVLPDVIEELRRDCDDFGIEFDTWTSERRLLDGGDVDAARQRLDELGETREADDAVWLTTSAHGDDQDRVLIRRTGAPTYLATDVAYHLDKYQRGHDALIDVWGPDHHGHVVPTRAGVACLGYPPDSFEILIHQTVRLLRGGEVVRMSKRAGAVVSLRELLDEVGRDVARFFLLMRSSDAHLDFDLDLAVERSEKNPVYYVQYAHTRMCGIFREAEAKGVTLDAASADLSRLTDPDELALLRRLADFPGEVLTAAEARAPHRITNYARDLATAFHQFYTNCRVLTEDVGLTGARLALVAGTRHVLRNALTILGVSAPERM